MVVSYFISSKIGEHGHEKVINIIYVDFRIETKSLNHWAKIM